MQLSTITNGYTTTIVSLCHVHIWVNDGNPSNTTRLYVNGNLVSDNSKGGSAGYGRFHHDHAICYPGDVLTWDTTGGVGSPANMALYTF